MGNCLDKSQSETEESSQVDQPSRSQQRNSLSNRNRRSRHSHRSSRNHYTRLNNSSSSNSSSLISLNGNLQRIVSTNQDINHNYLHGTSVGSFQTTNGSSIFGPSSSLPDSLQATEGTVSSSNQELSQNSTMQQQVFYLTPNVQRTADQLTEEDQIKLLKRMTLIQQLPSGFYDENKKHKECVICMIDFEVKDKIKCLPCMHTFHQSCIDSWLVRSLICPSCMEPVDAGLLSAFEN